MTNIGIHKNWIVYRCERDGVIELWRNVGGSKKAVRRVVTTATDFAGAKDWIDGMGKKKGQKTKAQERNSKGVDLSEYDNVNQTEIK